MLSMIFSIHTSLLKKGLLVALFLSVIPSVSVSQKKATISIHADENSLPTHLCIVTNDPLSKHLNSEKMLFSEMKCLLKSSSEATHGLTKEILKNCLTSDKRAVSSTIEEIIAALPVYIEDRSKRPKRECENACEHPFDSVEEKTAVNFKKKEEPDIVCMANSLYKDIRYAGQVRVLFITTDLKTFSTAGKNYQIKRITFSGAEIKIVSDTNINRANMMDPHMTVLGGHYATSTKKIPLDRGIQVVNLNPRCGIHEIQTIPFAGGAGVKVSVKYSETAASGKKVSLRECTAEPDAKGRFALGIPYKMDDSTKKHLDIKLLTPGKRSPASFVAEWDDARPEKYIKAKTRDISFAWKPGCLYPQNAGCPIATLPEIGLHCRDGRLRGNECEYTCSGARDKVGILFDLPTTVRFERRGSNAVWQDTLNYAGQKLEAYIQPEERQLEVDFSDWGSDPTLISERIGDRIEYIEIRSPKGDIHRIEPSTSGRQRLSMPWVRCGDLLTYRLYGDRNYGEGTLKESGGSIKMTPPSDTAERWSYLGAIGGGLEFSRNSEAGDGADSWLPILLYGWAKLGVSFKPVDMTLNSRAIWFEMEFSYMISKRYYFPFSTEETSADEGNTLQIDSVRYNRFFSGTTVMWAVLKLFSLGLGGGIGWGNPFYKKDELKTDPFDVFGAFWFHGLLRISRRTAFEIRFRMLIGSETQKFVGDYRGTPTHDDVRIFPALLLEGGIRFQI